jgi:hypothetical protein
MKVFGASIVFVLALTTATPAVATVEDTNATAIVSVSGASGILAE